MLQGKGRDERPRDLSQNIPESSILTTRAAVSLSAWQRAHWKEPGIHGGAYLRTQVGNGENGTEAVTQGVERAGDHRV